jgi:hypothetical protein
VVAAGKSNQVLRYVAQVDVKDEERASLKVSLSAVEKSSALGQLSGTDNLVALFTSAYGDCSAGGTRSWSWCPYNLHRSSCGRGWCLPQELRIQKLLDFQIRSS